MKRKCSMCGEHKEESEFIIKKRQGKEKYYAYCKNCERLYQKEYKRIWRERKKQQ